MSFAERFAPRWTNVIAPAVAAVTANGAALEPHRVDTRSVNDSILTEILDGISSDRLVFADLSSMGQLGNYPVRNGNVMYEVGLAHAVRLPEEVLLFRSDGAGLLFDVASIRVTQYDPDGDPAAARELVGNALVNAIKEIDLRRSKTVQAALQSLGFDGWILLAEAAESLTQPAARTVGDILSSMGRRNAIPRLLDLGLISSIFPKWTPDASPQLLHSPAEKHFQYAITPLGQAVLEASAEGMGISASNVEQMMQLIDRESPPIPMPPEA